MGSGSSSRRRRVGPSASSSGLSRSNKRTMTLLSSLFCVPSLSQSSPPPPAPLPPRQQESAFKIDVGLQNGGNLDESSETALESFCLCHDESVISKHHSSVGLETEFSASSTENGSSSSSSGSSDDTIVHTSSNGELRQPAADSVSPSPTLISLADRDAANEHSEVESTGNTTLDFRTASPRSVVSSLPVTSQQLSGFMPSDGIGEQDRIGATVLLVDTVSIPSSILPTSTADISDLEPRRNSRRMYWNAFSQSRFRRTGDSSTILITTSHADDLGSHDRWLLDFNGDLHYDGFNHESVFYGNRSHHRRGRRRGSRYEALEIFRDIFEEHDQETSLCAAGLHPRGTCSCDNLFGAGGSSGRPSIPQIIMLAGALHDVLEEIHHHHTSLFPSMFLLPAPEAVVDSFPLKNYKKLGGTDGPDHDLQQCNICLVDYEEGDKIRVLPCSHEYHMLCIDKWLKEGHRVCPLCRDDVCKGIAEVSASNQDIPSN